MRFLLPAILIATATLAHADTGKLLDAIRHVETGGHKDPANAVGDQGRSLGPYQIQKSYWQDARVAGAYEQVKDDAYARKVIIAYWTRYAKTALANNDYETLARIHNGGPKGNKKSATLSYWHKVKAYLGNQTGDTQ